MNYLLCCRYLTLREQKLMKRRREAENLLEDKKKLLEWEKRLDKEESLVRNLLNEALKLESSRNRSGQTSFTSEEEEHKGKFALFALWTLILNPNSHLLTFCVYNRSSGENLLKYQLDSSSVIMTTLLTPVNWPLPRSKNSHFLSAAKCTTFLVKMSFTCMRMKNPFHLKGWALNLVLIQRLVELDYCIYTCCGSIWIIIRFWETAHLPLPSASIYTYFSLRAKCWLRGGVCGQTTAYSI